MRLPAAFSQPVLGIGDIGGIVSGLLPGIGFGCTDQLLGVSPILKRFSQLVFGGVPVARPGVFRQKPVDEIVEVDTRPVSDFRTRLHIHIPGSIPGFYILRIPELALARIRSWLFLNSISGFRSWLRNILWWRSYILWPSPVSGVGNFRRFIVVHRKSVVRGKALLRDRVDSPVPLDQPASLQLGEMHIQRRLAHLAHLGKQRLARVALAGVGVVAVRQMPEHDLGGGLQAPLLDGPVRGGVAHGRASVSAMIVPCGFSPLSAGPAAPFRRMIEFGPDVLSEEATVREPCAGRGHMVRALGEYFGPENIEAADVHDYGVGFPVRDYLAGPTPEPVDWTITNPPFRLAESIAQRALASSRRGVALLVRTAFLEGCRRYERLFALTPPGEVMQFVERVPMLKGRLDPRGSTATAYCWLVWVREGEHWPPSHRPARLFWIPPCRNHLEREDDYA